MAIVVVGCLGLVFLFCLFGCDYCLFYFSQVTFYAFALTLLFNKMCECVSEGFFLGVLCLKWLGGRGNKEKQKLTEKRASVSPGFLNTIRNLRN